MPNNLPLMKTEKFLPGLEDQHEVGLSGVGVSVVDCTIAVNTSRTAAQLIASPPNTGSAKACGPVVHSHGDTPTAVIPMVRGGSIPTGGEASIQFMYCTADNSAVYLWAQSNTANITGGPSAGAQVRLITVR